MDIKSIGNSIKASQINTLASGLKGGSSNNSGKSKSKLAILNPINLGGKIMEIIMTVLSFGAFGIIGIISSVLKIIFYVLKIIFVDIMPFVIWYIGIPTFILGAIMGLIFLGGHILFIIVFIVGIFYYIKNLIKVVYKLPDNTNNKK
jgi:hypothetical protein